MYLKKKKKRNNIYSVISHALLNSLKMFINTISSISSHHTKYPKTVPHDLCACSVSHKINIYSVCNTFLETNDILNFQSANSLGAGAGLRSTGTFAFCFSSSCYYRCLFWLIPFSLQYYWSRKMTWTYDPML